MEDTKLDLKEFVMRSDEIEGNFKGYRPGNEKYEQNLISFLNIIRGIVLKINMIWKVLYNKLKIVNICQIPDTMNFINHYY